MCIVNMRVQCSDTFSEVLVGDVEYTELTIESIVGTALLEVFDTVRVESITVQHSPERNGRERVNVAPGTKTAGVENITVYPSLERNDGDAGQGIIPDGSG